MNKSLLSNIKNTLLVLLALSISISVVASNIILIMLLIIIILEGDFSNKIKKIISSNWMISIISLLLLYYLYWIFFGKFTDTNWILKRVSLLWLLPAFYSTNFTNKTIEKSVFSFFVSMFISSVLAISENCGILNINGENWTNSAFLKYTEHNIFLASSTLILIYSYFKISAIPIIKIVLIVFLPVYLISLFTEPGKSGQLVFILLLTIFIFVQLRKNIKYLVLTSSLYFLTVFMIYNSSEMIQKRFTHVISSFLTKQPTSRYLLFTNSLELIKKQPIIGYGTGSFTDIFRKIDKETEKVVRYKHKTPHNNYFYVWIELGIIGLIILLSIFYFQIRELIKLKDGFVRILLPTMYLVIMFTDSYLFTHNTLVLYIFLSVIAVNYQYKPS